MLHLLGRSTLLLALAGGIAASVVCARAGTTGSITGSVANASTRAPLAGVRVVAVSTSQTATVTTDASGAVVEGSPTEVADHVELWTFARAFASRDPNWLLTATEATH